MMLIASFVSLITCQIYFNPFSVAALAGIIVILLLLVASALISGSEVAYFALGPVGREEIGFKKGRIPRTADELLEKPDKLLATILIANNFVNIGIVIISTWVSNELVDFSSNPLLGFLVQTVIITFIILMIGEIMPKVYASRYSVRFALLMAIPLRTMQFIFSPLAYILIKTTSVVQKRLRDSRVNFSMDELSHALELTGEKLEEDEKILKGIVKFGNIDVKEIMRSRVDIVAVDIRTKFRDLLNVLLESGYSRIPVYINDLDKLKGILFIKDLLPHFHKGDSFRWQSLIRPPYFVPGNKKINDLLEEFQKNKMHQAIVVDEYGGTSGLITMEDILEEIVGEISDESDEDETLHLKVDNQTYNFEAKVLLNDFNKILDLPGDFFDPVKGEADTLAGLILELRGEIPEKGEIIEYNGFVFIVLEVDQRRITRIQVKIPKPDKDD